MKVTAAVTRELNADFTIEELELEDPRENEVLVKISAVGICHTDIAAATGGIPAELPGVLGHEGSGIVERVGSGVTSLKPGDHVVMSFTSCGSCSPCDTGHENYCQNFAQLNFLGMRIDGSKALKDENGVVSSHCMGQSSFSNYALGYENNVVKVRDDAPLELLGPLGCGIQTGAGTFMRSMACEAGSAVAIAGGGAVGLSAGLGAVVQGCNPIIVIEPHANRRELAIEIGATHVIDPMATEDLTTAISEIAPNGVNYALDTTSIQPVLDGLFPAMAAGGTLGLVAVPRDPEMQAGFHVITALLGGLTVKGICEGDADPQELIPVMVDLFMEGKFPFDKLCKFYEFDQINEAVAAQHDGSCVKAILKL